MYSAVHQTDDWDELNEFPRFLGREEAEHSANMPPPLPRVAWYVRVHWMMRRVAPRRMAALAAALVVLVPAAAALVLDTGPATGPAQIPKISVIQVKSIDQSPVPVEVQVPDSLQTAAQLEARLGYGINLAISNSGIQPGQSFEDQHAEAIKPPADPADPQDTPALLILRNLPENVSFTTGVPGGKGAWVMAAGDPNQLEMALGEGFDQPVSADVETISHAGLTLGLLHLELRRNVAAVAEAQAAPAPQETMSIAESEKSETEHSDLKQAEPQGEVKEAQMTPRKRVRRATAHSKSKVARADGGDIKRSKQASQWKTKTLEAGDDDKKSENQPESIVATEDDTAKGPIAKFFSWIASGGKGTAPGEAFDETKATLFPQKQ